MAPSHDDAPGGSSTSDLAISALHAWIGDYLAETNNPLHQPMALFRDNRPVDLSDISIPSTRRASVFVHGLASNESVWRFPAPHQQDSYGSLLRDQLGFEPLYVRYNSGQRVSRSGRQLAELLDDLVEQYGEMLDELLLVGHSMGGLVIRSACHVASEKNMPWVGGSA